MSDPNSYSSIGWLVVCAAAVLTIVHKAILLWRDINGGSQKREIQQPLEIRGVAEFAREKDCAERRDVLERRIMSLEERRVQDSKDWSASRGLLYNHIDTVRRELTEEIRGMPAQMIAILKNTGAIKGGD